MKHYIIIFILFIGVLSLSNEAKAQCNPKLVDICVSKNRGGQYMKHFIAKLKAAEPRKPKPIAKYQIVLNKGSHYRFNVANAKEYPGRAVIQLYSANQLVGTSFFKGKDFTMFDFPCQKTGKYTIYISFQDGKIGCAVGVLSIVRK